MKRIKKFLRKLLGVEDDLIKVRDQFGLLIEAINRTFDLRKKDKNIGTLMIMISIERMEKFK